MELRGLMSKPLISCTAQDSLSAAARQMWESDCGIVPVLGDDGGLLGVVTDRDICMATYTQGKGPQDIPITDVMAREVIGLSQSESVEAAERLMREHRVRRLVVFDAERRPVGVLSVNDLARHFAHTRRKDGAEHEFVQTMAAICEPRMEPSQPGAAHVVM